MKAIFKRSMVALLNFGAFGARPRSSSGRAARLARRTTTQNPPFSPKSFGHVAPNASTCATAAKNAAESGFGGIFALKRVEEPPPLPNLPQPTLLLCSQARVGHSTSVESAQILLLRRTKTIIPPRAPALLGPPPQRYFVVACFCPSRKTPTAFTQQHVYRRGGDASATALGAARRAGAAAPTAQGGASRRGRDGRFSTWRRRRRRRLPAGLSAVTAAAGLLAFTVWLCSPGGAAAAGAGAAGAGAGAKTNVDLLAEVDRAFWIVADNLGSIVNGDNLQPIAQAMVMFHAAWMTTSVCPIACAGVVNQPLGRAMIATASSHAFFCTLKFLLGVLALGSFPPIYVQSSRRPVPKPTAARRNKPPMRPPALKRPPPLLNTKRRGNPPTTLVTGGGGDKAQQPGARRIQVRRSAKSVPKLWLMALTAVGGPGVGAVGSAVAWKAGVVAIPAALSSLSRGSVLAVLAAGSLCYGGAGTALVARWAVFQGVFGAPFSAVLTPSALILVYLCNYYWRLAKVKRGESGPTAPPGKAAEKGAEAGKGDSKSSAADEKKRKK